VHKIKIRLPATVTNIGPSLQGLGLAVALHTTVEISGRDDDQLIMEISGEGADAHDMPLRHPVLVAMSRFFQAIEQTRLGINIRVHNQIPLNSGLGAEAAFTVAGLLGANDLMGGLYDRLDLLQIAATIDRPDALAASLLGGLVAAHAGESNFYSRRLPVEPFKLVIVVPELDGYQRPSLPGTVPMQSMLGHLARIPLVTEALRTGDLKTLVQLLDETLYKPYVTERISGYGHVAEMARRRGALAVLPCGAGPALVALATSDHDRIADEMRLAFQSVGVTARTWVLPVDTQGVVISIAQSL
jgi:homoserine kinase